jgi:hypothetical protein
VRSFFLLCLLVGGAYAAPSSLRRIHGELECRLGPAWLEEDAWSGRYPAYSFSIHGRSKTEPTISIEKFTRGNKLFPTPRAYLDYLAARRQPAKSAGLILVDGRKLQIWKRADPETRSISERFVIVESRDAYFVLKLRAPPKKSPKLDADFKEFLSSFKILK